MEQKKSMKNIAIAQYEENVTLEDCKNMTMHEIYEQIDKHHSSHHINDSDIEVKLLGSFFMP